MANHGVNIETLHEGQEIQLIVDEILEKLAKNNDETFPIVVDFFFHLKILERMNGVDTNIREYEKLLKQNVSFPPSPQILQNDRDEKRVDHRPNGCASYEQLEHFNAACIFGICAFCHQ